jgi:hypothetical protein
MFKIFLLSIAASITSFAQIELKGRVVDEEGWPLRNVHIRVRDSVLANSDSLGRFYLRISTDSAVVTFGHFSFRSYKFKVFSSQSIEIKLRNISYPNTAWNFKDTDKLLYKEKDKRGITSVYGAETVVLSGKLSADRLVLWNYKGYEIILPFDSLRSLIDKVGYRSDSNFEQNVLCEELNVDTVEITDDMLEEIGESTLLHLAINMLKTRNIVILASQKHQVLTVNVRRANWHGRRCNLCFWSGIQFVVPGGKEPLFTLTHIIS